MAKDTIKGVSVKIGADTSDFIKGLKKIDKEINQTQKTANELEKGLKLEFNEKNFVQAQKHLQKALETTEQKAESIRKEMQKLEQGGNVDTDGYKKLETELAKTETQAIQLRNQLNEINNIKLDKATEGAKKLSDGLETAAQKTRALSAAAVGAIAGIVKLGKDAVEVGDEIQTTADQYNLSAEAIQKWNYIALQSDVSSEQLYKSMTKVRDAVGTGIAGGTSTATKAIEALVGDLSKVPTDTEGAFNTIITALAGVEDKTLQAYYANEIFGERIATDLIPLLNQGADGVAQLGKEFESVGYLTNEQVRNLADYDNELNKFTTRINNVKTELGIALIPMLETLVDLVESKAIPAIQWLTDKFNNISPSMQQFITYGLLAIAMLSPMLTVLSKIVGIFPALMNGLSGLNGAFSAISKHPIILILGVIAGVLLILYTRNEEFRESVNELLDLLNRSAIPVLDTIQDSLQGIVELITPIIDALGNELAPMIELITFTLKPLVIILEWIFKLVNLINDAFLGWLGKGEVWGKGDVEFKNVQETNTSSTNINSLLGDYKIPSGTTSNSSYTSSTNNYVDNSQIVVNIEKNEYMSEDDIVKAVNKGLKQAKMART